MSTTYGIRVRNLTGLNASGVYNNTLLGGVEIPGSHYVRQWMESMGYPAETEDGTCGDVADSFISDSLRESDSPALRRLVKHKMQESLARHQHLLSMFAELRESCVHADDASAKHRLNSMIDALHLVVQQQQAMLEINAPILYSITWG